MRIVLIVLVVLMAGSLPADAVRGGHFGHGGGHFGHGGGHVSFGVLVGPQWWGPGWWGGPYPYYPYYPPQPVIVQPQPEIYVQPAPQPQETGYWFYCQETQGYYPYVKRCPNGWMKVVPPASPPGGE
jgi:hypothetical protein